jgi:hypothetical protein
LTASSTWHLRHRAPRRLRAFSKEVLDLASGFLETALNVRGNGFDLRLEENALVTKALAKAGVVTASESGVGVCRNESGARG